MFGIGASELIIILVLALIIFGPGKLPEVGRAVGRSIREFKKATSDALDDEQDGRRAGHEMAATEPDGANTDGK